MIFEYVVLAGVLLSLFLFGLLIKTIQEQAQYQPRTQHRPAPTYQKIDYSPTERERELLEDIYRLVYGDAELVRRLIDQVHNRNPDRSYEWCLQKVIRDLEYDRSR